MLNITVDWTWTWWVVLVMIVDITIRVLAVIVIPRNRRPTAAMAWLLAIYFIPIIGVLLFVMIGNPRLPRVAVHHQPGDAADGGELD